ncbi:hypothetical protein LL946_07500 [Knoellia locipacati]|uniref:hypothetical protein n=1 Tax=Knoellia locipacati TaxID=882824 RepID=UPI00384F8D01
MSSTPHTPGSRDRNDGPFDRDRRTEHDAGDRGPLDRDRIRDDDRYDRGESASRGDMYERDDRDHRDERDLHRGDTSAPVVAGTHSVTDVAMQKEAYGGVKPGAAFFGWLTATGMAVLLTALLAAAGAALSISTGTDVDQAAGDAAQNVEEVGIAGIIGLSLILLVAYFCGGYVAGRMARFSGAPQGVAVWVWSLVIAGLLALLVVLAGDEYNVLQDVNVFPRFPVDEGTLTTAGITALVVALLASLIGAILGGVAGVRYHRKVDRAGMVG